MTFKKKLEIGTGIPLFIFLILSVIFYLQVRWIGGSIGRVTEVEAPRCRALLNMDVELVRIGSEMMGYLLDPNPEVIERIEKYKKGFRQYQSVYCRLTEAEQGSASVVEIDRNSAKLWKVTEELTNLREYQGQRLALLRENLEEVDRISDAGFKSCTESEDMPTFDELKPFMEMRIWTDNVEEAINCYLIDHRQECKNRIFNSQENFGLLLEGYKEQNDVSPQGAWLEQLCNLHADNGRLVGDVVALEQRQEVRLQDFMKIRDELRSTLGVDIEQSHANFEGASQKSQRSVAISTAVTLILVFLGLIVAFISQQSISFMVTQPITELRNAAAKISQGQYDIVIEVDSDDELGQLADSIGKIAQELKRSGVSPDAPGEEAAEREEAGVSA